MKGQYRVVMEVMLFGIGVAITSFVLISFNDLQKTTESVSIRDQMNTVLNTVINGVVKASLTPNTTVRIQVPATISGRTYKFFVQNGKNLTVVDLKDTTINVSREIFNIDEPNKRVEGESVSSARIVEITNNGTKIIIQRG